MEVYSLSAIFIAAFLGSIGHCIGMCGGFVLAYTSAKVGEDWSKTHQSSAHFFYNIGRVTAYILLGALFGWIGSAFVISLGVWGSVNIAIGILMILLGLSLMGKIKLLTRIEASVSENGLYKKLYRNLIHSKSFFSFYALGVLNGFIPCGLVYIFATFALASGSVISGMLVMAVFGVATIPALFGFGFFASLVQKTRFRKVALTAAAVLIVAFGLFTTLKGTMMVVKPEMIQDKISNMQTAQEQKIKKLSEKK
ncbi:MAG: sulfite exporter TauE/SafE family protein [Thiovulaceae bacterium]|nr:sulfite exporter TauE/SafE family protein [Sulfurimonadaceae bacterium]